MPDTNDLFGASSAPPPPNLVKPLNEWRRACPKEIKFAAPGMFWLLVPGTDGVLVKADRPATTDLWHIEGHARACIERAGWAVETASGQGYDTCVVSAHRPCPLCDAEHPKDCEHDVQGYYHDAEASILAAALVPLRMLIHANR